MRDCLLANWRGNYTIPSAQMYPHQWNWDSAFIALGWASLGDYDRAYTELESLVGAQHKDGLIPHIAFNPEVNHYFPSVEWWPHRQGRDGRQGTAISNPPVAAIALRLLYDRHPDVRAYTIARHLHAWHEWWLEDRDTMGIGEPVIIHPWETGRDNSPEWDAALSVLPELEVEGQRSDGCVDRSQRPCAADYRHFLWLVRNCRETGGNQPLLASCGPFRMLDPGVSSVLACATDDLATVLYRFDARLAQRSRNLSAKVSESLARRSHKGLAGVLDLRSGAVSETPSAGWALNILRPDLTKEALDRIEREVMTGSLASEYGVRSWAKNHSAFDPHRYWRGPVWMNITWLVALGLRRQGRSSSNVLLDALSRVRKPFREYYDGDTGQGLGATDFSWTAALSG